METTLKSAFQVPFIFLIQTNRFAASLSAFLMNTHKISIGENIYLNVQNLLALKPNTLEFECQFCN